LERFSIVDYQSIFQNISAVIGEMEHLRKSAFQQYSILVDAVINNHITGQKEIEHIMDGLSDFGDHAEFFELYRKLCRHVYFTYPEMVGEHTALFRAQFMSRDGSDEAVPSSTK